MRILIIGARGLVGSHICTEFARDNDILAPGRETLDITRNEEVGRYILKQSPELIINCAVIGVDECERDPDLAYEVNVAGPRKLAQAASDINAEVMHLSTNYVFDGQKTSGYYTIDDAPAAVNIYGRTKWEGEQSVIAECPRSYVVRTSWVFGGRKPNYFNDAISSLRAGRSVNGIVDNWASTTLVTDLVKRIVEIIERRRYGTYQIVNDGICSKYEFALEAARALNIRDEDAELVIEPASSNELNLLAPRPRYTPMRCKLSDEIGLRPMRDWSEAIREYLTYENTHKERPDHHRN